MKIKAAQVLEVVCRYYEVERADVIGHVRRRWASHPRFMAYVLTREHCPHMSYHGIAKVYGNRDHKTVMAGRDKMLKLIASDEKWASDWHLLSGIIDAIANGSDIPTITAADDIGRVRELRAQIAAKAGELEGLEASLADRAKYNFMAAEFQRLVA